MDWKLTWLGFRCLEGLGAAPNPRAGAIGRTRDAWRPEACIGNLGWGVAQDDRQQENGQSRPSLANRAETRKIFSDILWLLWPLLEKREALPHGLLQTDATSCTCEIDMHVLWNRHVSTLPPISQGRDPARAQEVTGNSELPNIIGKWKWECPGMLPSTIVSSVALGFNVQIEKFPSVCMDEFYWNQ